MSGYTEATEWLLANAPEWWIKESQGQWEFYSYTGRRARETYRVELNATHPTGPTPVLYGEGPTLLEAVKTALNMPRERTTD